eukprot:jgi/Mesen1/886/ME000115S00009
MGLTKLASGLSYQSLNACFGYGLSTVARIVDKFTKATTDHFGHLLLMPRTGRALQDAIDLNFAARGVPNCVGSIDVTHIQIQLPNLGNAKAYFDRNKNYSICLQAVVGQNGMFYDVNVGCVGSMHDMRVLRRSWVWRKNAAYNGLFQGPTVRVGGHDVPPYILGDGGYSMDHWLISPFRGSTANPLTGRHKQFNTWLSSTRMVRACCILVNMLILKNEDPLFYEQGNIPLPPPVQEIPHYRAPEDQRGKRARRQFNGAVGLAIREALFWHLVR